jgi:antitoxin component YwqK of YwqJK toxin-antitoxin module
MDYLKVLLFLYLGLCYAQAPPPIPIKHIRSYKTKTINVNGKDLFMYNDKDNIPLMGLYKISLFFLDNSKNDSSKGGNDLQLRTLVYDTKYSRYSSSNINVKGKFIKGCKNGLWITTYDSKRVKTTNWNNGLIIGKYRVYDTEGKHLYQINFGPKGNGKFKDYYYKTGVLKQEGDYQNGKKEGEWCNYNTQGELTTTVHYKQGIIVK